VVFPNLQLMRVSEEPVCIYLFRQNPVFTSLHLRSPESIATLPPFRPIEGHTWFFQPMRVSEEPVYIHLKSSFYLPAFEITREHSHAPSIRSHRGTEVPFPDFQPMRVSEEPVCIYLFRQNPVFTSLHLRYPESIATLTQFRLIEGHQWFFQISSQMRVSEEPVCTYLFRQNPVFNLPAFEISRVHSHAYPIPSHRGTSVVFFRF
jgi:hypothetical protein